MDLTEICTMLAGCFNDCRPEQVRRLVAERGWGAVVAGEFRRTHNWRVPLILELTLNRHAGILTALLDRPELKSPDDFAFLTA